MRLRSGEVCREPVHRPPRHRRHQLRHRPAVERGSVRQPDRGPARLTKNTVIGRVHRMGLPGRASPIIRNGAPKPKRLSGSGALVGPTLPPVSAPQAVRAALQIAEVATSLPNAPQTVFRARPSHACCWPFGDPKKPGFRFCDGPAPAGEPYCPEHRAVAWVSVARRDAA